MNILDQFFRCAHQKVLLVCSQPKAGISTSEVFFIRKKNNILCYSFGSEPVGQSASEVSLRNHIEISRKYRKIIIKADFTPKGLK